ncbi:MAG: N-acetyltransferase [Mesorhizobium sp.]|uniref:GNAT family N-acetyltransferase n=1 Tax=Mesorhizobium sp. TaxID=1871066 RepID=UPI000FE3A174|nr:GNAT family N-acetyltransferase [Mesorhizobium sp.]RWJ04429.1 MAG: N-acetyltransferase [Mesorhizobium sp.]RWJ15192.1 MAG: N-acetyltransferase [Mesorhizobium sp.]
MELQTERLLLREWRDEDVEPLARMNDDPRVVRYVARLADRRAIEAWINTQREHFKKHRYGLWALERLDVSGLIGFCGLANVSYRAHFTPAVEIAWRLQPDCWGRGYATEAAVAALAFGFQNLKLNQIVANAAADNVESRRVMERIGMSHEPKDDFDHPLKAVDDPLRRQVLYRLTYQDWRQKR